MSTSEIAIVILWQDGQVMAFDCQGQPLSAYQGPLAEVKPRLDAVYQGPWFQGNWLLGSMEPMKQGAAPSLESVTQRLTSQALRQMSQRLTGQEAKEKDEP